MTEAPQFRNVMLTGHRPNALTQVEITWSKRELLKTLKRLKAFHGIEEVISGFALGADTWWAEYALELDLPLAAYIPFEAQPSKWPVREQGIWRELRAKADREVVLGEEYQVWLLHARNDAMIKDAELCVALWKQSKDSGGTFSAVKKIRQQGKPLILLDPETRTITSERLLPI
jgi:uncharacterized phage-like protein YoqJ